MKKLMILILLVSSVSVFGQSAQFGIKGGLNFGSTGEFSDLTDNASTTIDGDNKVGFHVGVYSKFKFLGIFVQPEILYTRLNTEYSEGGATADYNFSKIDIPLLVGIDVVGPLNLKAGPSFQLALNNDLEGAGIDIGIQDPENSFTIGYQIGAGLQLGRLGVDLRYEGAFSENNAFSEANEDFGFVVDSRPSQWILSLSYQLKGDGDKK
ncbi:outer membrane beta-barrel protein [Dokdonia ponticola]|uniref:Outer membrane beta-barrel protein n=1 Tax=Dokdonia ponticola TaxID=2041041 RepID=A0ABV9HS19_9FLAO